MNLATEYSKRHGNEFILPTNDGLCYFNDYKRHALIATTSSTFRSHTACHLCGDKRFITLELFSPSLDEAFTVMHHGHIHPDEDVYSVIREISSRKLISCVTPVYLKTGAEIETWLWKFFLFHNRLRRSQRWINFIVKKKITEDPIMSSYEEMTICACHFPKKFNLYYRAYQEFVTGRKYLLFE
jgi:hypothetical protein